MKRYRHRHKPEKRQTHILLGIMFTVGGIASAIWSWHHFGNPVMPCLNMFVAGFCAAQLVDIILS